MGTEKSNHFATTRRAAHVAVLALGCSLFPVLSGCNQNVDLASIRAFTQAAADQQGSFADLAADFYASCQRSREWSLLGSVAPNVVPEPINAAQQRQLRAAIRAQAQAGTNVAAAAQRHAAAGPAGDSQDGCQLEADASDQWEKANLVLLNYVVALGNLAGGASDSGDTYGFDSMAKELSASSTLSTAQSDAFKTGADEIATQLFAAKRRDAIAPYVLSADAVLDRWIDILQSVANVNYRFELLQERRDVNHFFVDNFTSTPTGLPALQALQYKDTWRAELALLDGRVAALNAYVKALEALRKAHHAVVVRIHQTGFSDFTAIVSGYVAELTPELKTIRAVYDVQPKPINGDSRVKSH